MIGGPGWRVRGAAVGVAVLLVASACSPGERVGPTPPAPDAAPQASRTYQLRVASTPTGATVRIDGVVAGKTPVTQTFNTPPALTVEVAAPGHVPVTLRTDAQWWLRSGAARAAARFGRNVVARRFDANLPRRYALHVVSQPPGAAVSVNGESRGSAPIAVVADRKTPLRIAVTLRGYVPHVTTVDDDWWAHHEVDTVLDQESNAYVATLSARLFRLSQTRWTQVGSSGGYINVPLVPGATQRQVRATIRGPGGRREVTFIYDTGATFTTLDRETAEAIGLRFDQADVTIRTRTANGEATRAVVLLPELTIDRFTVRNVAISQCDACRDGDTVGLMGLNVAGEFATTVTPDGKQMRLTPNRAGAGRKLSISAFLEVNPLTARTVAFANQSALTMRNLKVALVQRNANGEETARTETEPFTLAPGTRRIIEMDLSRFAPNQSYQPLVVEGEW